MRLRASFAVAASVLATIAACSSSEQSGLGTTVTGTVHGTPLSPQSARVTTLQTSDAVRVYVTIADVSNACPTQAKTGGPSFQAVTPPGAQLVMPRKNTTVLEIGLGAWPSLPIPAGTIVIGAGSDATARFFKTDSTCREPAPASGYGSITLTTSTKDDIAGSFELTFDGDHVTGSFDANKVCANSAVSEAAKCE